MTITVETEDTSIDGALALFRAAYGKRAPALLTVPYRICPLGAHVDHQYGQVLAGAINHSTALAFEATADAQITCNSDQFAGAIVLALDQPGAPQPGSWANHLRGALAVLGEQHTLRHGLRVAISGARSQAGLSSSAAVVLGFLQALATVNEVELSARELVQLASAVETGYLGLRNGALDPAAIALAKPNALSRIDTRTLDVVHHPAVQDGACFVAMHSGLSAALTPANFNQRVDETLGAAARLSDLAGLGLNAPRLGDVPIAVYEQWCEQLDPLQQRRAAHFYSEIERVDEAARMLSSGAVEPLGALMSASGRSSIANYECGATPVKDLYQLLVATPGVLGARFCGPGFRGCVLALIRKDQLTTAVEHAWEQYAMLHPQLAADSWALRCELVDGRLAVGARS